MPITTTEISLVRQQALDDATATAETAADDCEILYNGDGTTSAGTAVPAGEGYKDFYTVADPDIEFTVTIADGENPTSLDTEDAISSADGTWKIVYVGGDSVSHVYIRDPDGAATDGVRISTTNGNGINISSVESSAAEVVKTIGTNGYLDGGKTLWIVMDATTITVYDADPTVGSPTPVVTAVDADFQAVSRIAYVTSREWGVYLNGTPTEITSIEFTPAQGDATSPNTKVNTLWDRLGDLDPAAEADDYVIKVASGAFTIGAQSGGGGGGAPAGGPFGRPAMDDRGALWLPRQRLATARAGTSAAGLRRKMTIHGFGDSLVDRPEWFNEIRARLTADGYADNGDRCWTFETATASKGEIDGTSQTVTGTWSDSDDGNLSGGFDRRAGTSSTALDTWEFDHTVGGGFSALKVFYKGTTGTFKIYVDTVLDQTVDASLITAGELGTVDVSTAGDVVEFEVVSGTVTLSNVLVTGTLDYGVGYMKSGNGGSPASQWEGRSAADWETLLDYSQPDVIALSLGANDIKIGVDTAVATAAASVGAVIDDLLAWRNTDGVGVPVLMYGIHDGDPSFALAATTEAFRAALYTEVTSRDGVAWIDGRAILGPWDSVDIGGALADTVHFSDEGAHTAAAATCALLTGRA